MDWASSPLGEEHELTTFDCGTPALNGWLATQAVDAAKRGTAKTFVWTPIGSDTVVAYYAITPHLVAGEGLTSAQAGGLSAPVPAYLLAKLALDRSLHGQGHGAELLHDALTRIVEAAELASGRLIVVDAIDDRAVEFYRKYDFKSVAGNPRRLVIKVSTVRQALG
ncbi:GNAT family N-acetyltransferase [Saccharothrix violaceirubra]|uniref:GNAT family N-acetyltransferase n=1 Tax=Saccharothrix violaceirubra TaxID=413306 RepID=UPI001611A057|nr:GNAT family N-acetyltransferase [Saccharothrix violaceirubra]